MPLILHPIDPRMIVIGSISEFLSNALSCHIIAIVVMLFVILVCLWGDWQLDTEWGESPKGPNPGLSMGLPAKC